ncbi:DNA-binding response regulator [Halothiobacillus diazotrophicus]|uniref:DNA-binding response regulator n=1 Tax=Halothiobacillus diazotrophicus TaxID=1860122 RepID=A0A191ZG08_9GAMM|nr:response regulator transcription factor [Halothiobacillus diazotrophicus]ANJ66787.1 DNA-binding response regulator [Halothiobacillus diazotrophicus]
MNAPKPERGIVLLVDDAPDNLRMLHEALQSQGYMVLVATDGQSALDSVQRLPPDVIVLDARMPGMDGFETCRRLKEGLTTRDIPVIFMTGLSDTEYIIQGFQAGGVDYVTKPIVIDELLARITTHMHRARLVTHTRSAIDSAGRAILAFDPDFAITWATPLAQRLVQPLVDIPDHLPSAIRQWLKERDGESAYPLWHNGERLLFTLLEPQLLCIQRHAAQAEPDMLARMFQLTAREAEALYWVTLGKTNREIGEIMQISPRTVNKHLEHVFEKLGVETRTAAAALVLSRTSA